MLVKVCGNNGECFAGIRHLHPRHRSCDWGQRCILALRAQHLAALYERRCLANDGACSALHSSGDEPITVVLLPANRDEKRTGRSLATVVNDRGNLRLGGYQRPLRPSTRDPLLQFHATGCKYRTPANPAQVCGELEVRRVQWHPSAVAPAPLPPLSSRR